MLRLRWKNQFSPVLPAGGYEIFKYRDEETKEDVWEDISLEDVRELAHDKTQMILWGFHE